MAFIEVNSEKHMTSGVIPFTIWRYAESVYPAIGARATIGLRVFVHEKAIGRYAKNSFVLDFSFVG